MASERLVQVAVERLAAATNHRFFGEKEQAQAVKVYRDALQGFSDDAVREATEEWVETMAKFPALVEFVTLVRSHQVAIEVELDEARRARMLESGVRPPERRAAVGKPGSEAIATQIVLNRMVREVGLVAPLGYFGRLAGMTDLSRPSNSARDLGHTHEAGACVRCDQLAAIAFEQAVDFEHSTASWEGWERPAGTVDMDALRRCVNSACSYGWVTKAELDGTERLSKCETCGGPQPKVPRAKVMDGEEMVTTTKRRRR